MNQPVSVSFGENTAGIGHYKGVMLCNRPFAGSVPVSAKENTSSVATFTCGVVPSNIGLNVPVSMKEKMIKRPKKDSVLVKHKKWLQDLQEEQKRLTSEYIEAERRKEEDKARFMEHEKTKREMAKINKHYDHSDNKRSSSSSSTDDKSGPSPVPESHQAEEKGVGSDHHHKVESKRPAWAVSEAAAERAAELRQQNEEDDLLNFAQGLDYERYIGDVEVQLMMDRLRRRITELEKEVAADELREADSEGRFARREMLRLMNGAEQGLQSDAKGEAKDETQVAMGAAKALLGDDEDMSAVHSTKSVVALLKQAKDKIGSVHDAALANRLASSQQLAEPKVSNEPRIVVHEPSDGARLEVKQDISKLPYMHRNPSV